MKLTASNGFTVMVESPLYFHSIRPVLASLQKFDMEAFPLMQEVVRCQPSEHIPEYLSKDIRLNASSIFEDKSMGYAMGEFVGEKTKSIWSCMICSADGFTNILKLQIYKIECC